MQNLVIEKIPVGAAELSLASQMMKGNRMKIWMSPNIAIRTTDTEGAFNFYSKVLGFPHRPENKVHTDLDADPLNLFIIEDSEVSGPVMELFVENLDMAKEELLANGCEVIRWEGKGKDCYVKDPYGIIFNVWEQKEHNS